MKNLLLIILVMSSWFSLNGQNQQNKNLIHSLEFSLGIRNVNISNNNEFNTSRGICIDYCNISLLQNPGYEITSKLLWNLRFKQKNEILLGIGFNSWHYTVDILQSYTEERTSNIRENVGTINFIIGYRHLLKKFNRIDLFAEALSNTQFVPTGKFVDLMVSVEPGLGLKFHISDRVSINSNISYKIGLNDISYTLGQIHKVNSLGIRFGLDKAF